MIVWKEEFVTGIPIIDEQHRKLFEIGERLYGMLDNPETADHSESLKQVLKELTGYAKYHFEFEEGLLEAAGYPALEVQEREHERFFAKVEELSAKDLEINPVETTREVLEYVLQWIGTHILEKDMDYQTYV
jgi:hemerythrin